MNQSVRLHCLGGQCHSAEFHLIAPWETADARSGAETREPWPLRYHSPKLNSLSFSFFLLMYFFSNITLLSKSRHMISRSCKAIVSPTAGWMQSLFGSAGSRPVPAGPEPHLTASVCEQFWFPESCLSVIVLLKMTSKTQTSQSRKLLVFQRRPPTPTPGPALRTVVFKHILRSREASVLERMFSYCLQ